MKTIRKIVWVCTNTGYIVETDEGKIPQGAAYYNFAPVQIKEVIVD